jgi:ribosome-associated heat shock protein Hsp15
MRTPVHRADLTAIGFQLSAIGWQKADRCKLTAVTGVRLDQWLDVACLFKTRSEATKACRLNKVIVNGQAAKPHREVRIGDELEIHRPLGRKQLVTVLGIAESHLPKSEARLLYEDRTPKPTPEEIEIRRLERIYRAAATPLTRPDRDQRRTLRRLKRGG